MPRRKLQIVLVTHFYLFACLLVLAYLTNPKDLHLSPTSCLLCDARFSPFFKKLNLKEIQSKKSKQAVSSMNGDCDSSTYSEKGKTDLYPSLWPAALLSYGSLITSKGTHHSPFMGEVACSYPGTGSKQLEVHLKRCQDYSLEILNIINWF